MPRTASECCLSFILIGVMLVVFLALEPIFGPQPLANPIAAGIALAIVIVCCCCLSMNRVIIAKIKNKIQKDTNIICPYCHTVIKSKAISCPQCGNQL